MTAMAKTKCVWCEGGNTRPNSDMLYIHQRCFFHVDDMVDMIKTVKEMLEKGEPLPEIVDFIKRADDFARRWGNVNKLVESGQLVPYFTTGSKEEKKKILDGLQEKKVSQMIENLKQLEEADEKQFGIIIDTFEYSPNPSIQRHQCNLLIKLKQSISKNREEFKAWVEKRAELLEASANHHTGTGDIENTKIAVRLDYQSKELRKLLEGEGGGEGERVSGRCLLN